jgi:hyperosmotically inducible protein
MLIKELKMTHKHELKKHLVVAAIFGVVIALTSLSGCENRTSSGETVGQAVGQTVDKAIDKTNATVDKAGNKINDVARTTEEVLKVTAGGVQEKAQQVGTIVDDSAITASIKADLVKDPGLSALRIDVNTVKGEVTLKGETDGEAARERAGRIALAIAGVAKVNNLISIKG